MLHFGQKLKQARVSAQLNMTQAAEKLSKSRSTYQYWEQEGPPIDEIPVIVKAFNLPDNYFFGTDPDIFSKMVPVGDLQITLKDHIEEIKNNREELRRHNEEIRQQKEFLQRIVESSLKTIVASLVVPSGQVPDNVANPYGRTVEQLDKGVNDFVSKIEEANRPRKQNKKGAKRKPHKEVK